MPSRSPLPLKSNPHIQSLSPDEQRLFRLYGKLPTQKDMLTQKLKACLCALRLAPTFPLTHPLTRPAPTQDRKYFDSGDYALQKAGKTTESGINATGREHPSPESIPHLSSSPSAGGEPRASFSAPPGVSGMGALPTLNTFSGAGGAGASGSPVKESSFLQRGESIDDQPGEEEEVSGGALPIRGER